MASLILTSSDSGAGALKVAGLADCVIPLGPRFVWGQLQPPSELDQLLSPRSAGREASAPHWLDNLIDERFDEARRHGLGLIEFSGRFDSIELWIDPEPNSQLQLLWLLSYLRPHADVIARLALVHMSGIADQWSKEAAASRLQATPIRNDHLDTAGSAWAAWRAPTPEAWFDLLARDVSALPYLRNTVVSLLEELPMRDSGLGATEMRMLELISEGHVHPYDLFPGHLKPNERRVFDYWEVGGLLDGLAHCPAPAVSGLDEGPFTLEMHNDAARHQRYKRSKLSLTPLGEAILAGTGDFSRHNPIDRWWGGTGLTNDRLWRWNSALVAP
jgi:hypothetical protein